MKDKLVVFAEKLVSLTQIFVFFIKKNQQFLLKKFAVLYSHFIPSHNFAVFKKNV